jgi:hypothetical protein
MPAPERDTVFYDPSLDALQFRGNWYVRADEDDAEAVMEKFAGLIFPDTTKPSDLARPALDRLESALWDALQALRDLRDKP